MLLIAVIGAVALLAWRNLGRDVSAPAEPAHTVPVAATLQLSPTPVVTPRITTPTTPTPRVAATTAPAAPVPTPTPQPHPGVIAHTDGAGVVVRSDPGPQAPAIGSLREGATVILTGNQQTVAARSWTEVQSTQQSLKGWVSSDFVDQLPSQP